MIFDKRRHFPTSKVFIIIDSMRKLIFRDSRRKGWESEDDDPGVEKWGLVNPGPFVFRSVNFSPEFLGYEKVKKMGIHNNPPDEQMMNLPLHQVAKKEVMFTNNVVSVEYSSLKTIGKNLLILNYGPSSIRTVSSNERSARERAMKAKWRIALYSFRFS
ncbi:hypothetical protein NPIL_216161 [Nephila pilipes]|uniref:Uncharacterized protein n=1 Tax=Nephila pilipes TaxID=299642 RepID=A0A8X6NFJ2_NEPPI|nr:hypothetical protein NPIL_216161 [Nephila pilipes]